MMDQDRDREFDFDFLFGDWPERNRRLKGRLKGSTERQESYSQKVFGGRHIFNRFIWTVASPVACHWEQAFSEDGGRSWETNWTMEFTRHR
jgi:hypothetical protein